MGIGIAVVQTKKKQPGSGLCRTQTSVAIPTTASRQAILEPGGHELRDTDQACALVAVLDDLRRKVLGDERKVIGDLGGHDQLDRSILLVPDAASSR